MIFSLVIQTYGIFFDVRVLLEDTLVFPSRFDVELGAAVFAVVEKMICRHDTCRSIVRELAWCRSTIDALLKISVRCPAAK